MIDVHVIAHPIYDRSESRARLLEQLATEPVNVHVVEGVAGHIGKSRLRGFSQGAAPWCSYVDDDDRIEPGIFSEFLEAVEREPDLAGACTQERIRKKDGSFCTSSFPRTYYDKRDLYRIHHLPLFSRAAITPHLPALEHLPDGSEHSLWAYVLLDGGKVRHIPKVGYHWIKHEENSPTLNIPMPPRVRELHQRLMRAAAEENYAPNAPSNPPIRSNYRFFVA